MRNEAGTKEALFAREGAVDELVGDDELAGRQFLFQRTAGRHRNHVGHANAFQGVDIGAVVDRGRRLDMAAAMAGQEHQVGALVGAEQQRVGRLAPGRLDPLPARLFEAGNVIDAAAADDAENGSGHWGLLAWRCDATSGAEVTFPPPFTEGVERGIAPTDVALTRQATSPVTTGRKASARLSRPGDRTGTAAPTARSGTPSRQDPCGGGLPAWAPPPRTGT